MLNYNVHVPVCTPNLESTDKIAECNSYNVESDHFWIFQFIIHVQVTKTVHYLFSDMMSQGMERLKGLAQGLGDEIQSQNEQLDRINTGVDRADIKIKDQNRQMRKILK